MAKTLVAFSLTERIVFSVFATVFAASSLSLLWQLNAFLTIPVAASGGEIREGVIGIPRFINPLLSISDADRDLTTLIYSGLMKADTSGKLIPDLAETIDISDNGLEYTFTLRPDATFHDGKPVTANDVLFTVRKAQDPNLKSPRRASWEGVTAEAVDSRTVILRLKQPYAPFLENATLGILPSHIWKDVDVEEFTFSQFNIEPVGSGPYQLKRIKRDSGGIPVSYTLTPFEEYALGTPHIEKITIRFYTSEDALIEAFRSGHVDSINSISPSKALALKAMGARIENVSLPRIFAVFFNQNEAPIFTNAEVRMALNDTVDRERIVKEVFSGYATEIDGPIPATISGTEQTSRTDFQNRVQEARALLESKGWKPAAADGVLEKKIRNQTHRLEFTVSTANSSELKAAAKIIKENWEQIGAKVDVNFFDVIDLNQNVIRPRKYHALFFGEVIGRDMDFFAFWHSSQRNDPGLNIALYTNIKADKLLENARATSSPEDRIKKYLEFEAEIDKDIPAVFTHSPDFIYLLPKNVSGVQVTNITIPSDRFFNIHEWYIETDRVWKIFAKNEQIQE